MSNSLSSRKQIIKKNKNKIIIKIFTEKNIIKNNNKNKI